MNTNDYTIRLEKKEEHRKVENLVREAFWTCTVQAAVSIL